MEGAGRGSNCKKKKENKKKKKKKQKKKTHAGAFSRKKKEKNSSYLEKTSAREISQGIDKNGTNLKPATVIANQTRNLRKGRRQLRELPG